MDDINQLNSLPEKSRKGPLISSEKTATALRNKISEIELKTLEKITETKAKGLGLPHINLKGFPVSPDALILIPLEQTLSLKTVCFFYSGSEIRLGCLEPTAPETQALKEDLEKQYYAKIELYLISEASFNLAVDIYKKIPRIKKDTGGVTITESELSKFQTEIKSLKELENKVKEINITDLMALVIAMALKTNSSDIHIEAEEKDIKIRYRIDGALYTVATIHIESWGKIISRVKLIAGLKLNVTAKPQDGRFTIFLSTDKVEVRVSTIPTAYGESVVMRLLRSSAAGLKFEDLGLNGQAFLELEKEIKRPNGMIISTGPTGSGKTTTLYAIINKLNDPQTKIITLEDPIEYKLAGINQSQVDYGKDYTFAKGLRSILRQDPDIVMVGEIRDLETADVSINAALTGHLVISTIHTNSAAGVIPRFLAMGVKPFLLSPALNAVIGQRLVRKICDKCKAEDEIDKETMEKIINILSAVPQNSKQRLLEKNLNNLKFYKGKGCDACQGLGYKGRIGIFEILIMSPEMEKIILSNKVSEYEIQTIAVKNGMLTMAQDGLLKASDGITSVEEVFKVAE